MDFFNNVCIYMRLSKDDGDKAESESISNQRKLLKRYAEDIGIKINKEYVDDGYSGTNFNRPKFKEMISDGLRHKSKLAGKHMRDLKDYKNGKY